MKNMTKGERAFNIANNIVMFILLCIMLYPILNQLSVSLSSNTAVISGQVTLFPKGFNINAYKEIIADINFVTSMKNTIFFTIINTLASMFFTAIFAYPLSKRHLKGKNVIMSLIIFSMLFGTGGLIPNYLLIRSLKLTNTYLALILPGAINIWNVVILKNFYQQIPASIEESAYIDGSSPINTFVKIVLPLSVPSLAALTMFVAIASWNTFFQALIYISDPAKKLLQVYLNDIIQANIGVSPDAAMLKAMGQQQENVNAENLKAAVLICTIVPIIIIYPFVQKYFMSGLMVGSVKG